MNIKDIRKRQSPSRIVKGNFYTTRVGSVGIMIAMSDSVLEPRVLSQWIEITPAEARELSKKNTKSKVSKEML